MRNLQNPSFLKFFLLLLIAELMTILASWMFLNIGISHWINQRVEKLASISKVAQSSVDWSKIDQINKKQSKSKVFQSYLSQIKALNQTYFPRNDGEISVFKIMKGEEFALISSDQGPYESVGKPSQWDLEASQGRFSSTPLPYSDEYGTRISAYAPIYKDGTVFAFIEVDSDSSSLYDFKDIVRTSFMRSIGPAALISIILAIILAAKFVDPMEFLHEIHDEKEKLQAETEKTTVPPLVDPNLTPKENEVAYWVSEGLRNPEIAEKLCVVEDTVKKHLSNIFDKLGFRRRAKLIVHYRSRLESTSSSPSPKV